MAAPTGAFYNVAGTPSLPQFARLVMYGHTVESSGSNKPLVGIFDFRAPFVAAGGSEVTLGLAFRTALGTTWQDCAADSYTWDTLLTRFFDDPTNAGSSATVNQVGAITTDRQPSFSAVVTRKLSGLSGRNFRGSTHWGALPESFTTKDELNATGNTAYTALLGALNSLISAGISDGVNDFFPIILSPTRSVLTSNPRIITGSWQTSFALNVKVGTMKRRKQAA